MGPIIEVVGEAVYVDDVLWADCYDPHKADIIFDALTVMFAAVKVIANRTNSNAVEMGKL